MKRILALALSVMLCLTGCSAVTSIKEAVFDSSLLEEKGDSVGEGQTDSKPAAACDHQWETIGEEYHRCSLCGLAEEHIWVEDGQRKICSVCYSEISHETEAIGESEEASSAGIDQAGAGTIAAAPIRYSLVEDVPSEYKELKLTQCTASSELYWTSRQYLFSAANVIDGDDQTCWQENADGYGLGESLSMTLAGQSEVYVIGVRIGYTATTEGYYGNARPSDLMLTFSEGNSVSCHVEDKNAWQYLYFPDGIETTSLKVVIEDVYAGSEWHDTALAEITLYGLADVKTNYK